MLYATTRDNSNPHTAHRVIHEKRNPDGGFYVPFRHPKFEPQEIEHLCGVSFGQCVAEILNRMLNTHLTQWDIDFYCGRNPISVHGLNTKTFVAEAWHTRTGSFDGIARGIAGRICESEEAVSDWLDLAVRAAVWFGVFGELKKKGIEQADVSVISGDFTVPMSAWYARQWGLPIGQIVCCCNENNGIWELLSYGQMRTDLVNIATMIPEADVSVPAQLERLVYEAGDLAATARYLDAVRHGRVYHPDDATRKRIGKGLYPAVISSRRLENTIPSVFRTNSYLMTPATALSYAGLQDYRAKTGQTLPAVIWAEDDPTSKSEILASVFGISDDS